MTDDRKTPELENEAEKALADWIEREKKRVNDGRKGTYPFLHNALVLHTKLMAQGRAHWSQWCEQRGADPEPVKVPRGRRSTNDVFYTITALFPEDKRKAHKAVRKVWSQVLNGAIVARVHEQEGGFLADVKKAGGPKPNDKLTGFEKYCAFHRRDPLRESEMEVKREEREHEIAAAIQSEVGEIEQALEPIERLEKEAEEKSGVTAIAYVTWDSEGAKQTTLTEDRELVEKLVLYLKQLEAKKAKKTRKRKAGPSPVRASDEERAELDP